MVGSLFQILLCLFILHRPVNNFTKYENIMKVSSKSKSGHPVKVVSHCSNKIMQPRTKQTDIQLC